MANLIQLSDDLEFVNKNELIQMSQDPNSRYPSYLVLAEIKRRTMNEKAYAAQQPRPETTVSEEVIQEFAGPQGLGAMAQSSGSNAFPPDAMSNMAPPSPMQAMASGGIVGYKNKGKTEYKEAADDYGKQLQEIFEKEGRYKKRYSDYEKGERFTYPLSPKDYVVSDEEYSRLKEGDYVMGEGALQEYRPFLMLLNALDGESGARYMPESEVKGLKAKLKASIMEDKLSQMGMASGGRTGYQVGGFTPTGQNPYPTGTELVSDTFTSNEENPYPIDLEQKNAIKERYTDPDGTFAYGRALKDGFNAATLAMIFAPEPTTTAIGGGLKAIAAGGKGLFNAIRNPRAAIDKSLEGLGRLKTKINPLTPTGAYKDIGKDVLKKQGPRVAGSILLGSQLLPEGVEEVVNNEDTTKSTEQLEIDRLNKLILSMKNTDNTNNNTSKDRGNADMLVGLGGAIMSSKNVGELGENISNVYTGIQKRRDTKELAGLQGRLMEAQISKYEADIANMPVKQLEFALKQLDAQITAGSFSSDEERKQAEVRYNQLLNSYLAKTGFASLDVKNQRNKNLGLEGLITEVG